MATDMNMFGALIGALQGFGDMSSDNDALKRKSIISGLSDTAQDRKIKAYQDYLETGNPMSLQVLDPAEQEQARVERQRRQAGYGVSMPEYGAALQKAMGTIGSGGVAAPPAGTLPGAMEEWDKTAAMAIENREFNREKKARLEFEKEQEKRKSEAMISSLAGEQGLGRKMALQYVKTEDAAQAGKNALERAKKLEAFKNIGKEKAAKSAQKRAKELIEFKGETKVVYDEDSPTKWSWADVRTGNILKKGAPAPASQGEQAKLKREAAKLEAKEQRELVKRKRQIRQDIAKLRKRLTVLRSPIKMGEGITLKYPGSGSAEDVLSDPPELREVAARQAEEEQLLKQIDSLEAELRGQGKKKLIRLVKGNEKDEAIAAGIMAETVTKSEPKGNWKKAEEIAKRRGYLF